MTGLLGAITAGVSTSHKIMTTCNLYNKFIMLIFNTLKLDTDIKRSRKVGQAENSIFPPTPLFKSSEIHIIIGKATVTPPQKVPLYEPCVKGSLPRKEIQKE